MRNNRRGNANFRWVAVLAILLVIAGTAFAVPVNPTITLTSDVNGDGIAGVGDTITMSCRSANVTAGDTPYADAGLLGNSHFTLANIVSNFYSSIYGPIAKGSLDTTAFRPRFYDDTGFLDSGSGISLDVQPPNSPMGISLQSSYAHGAGGIYKIGDSLYFTLQFDDQDGINGSGRLRVFADLSTVGLGTNVPLTGPTGVGVYTFNQQLPLGRERNADTFSVLAVDDAGNKQTYAAAISYDTREPEIESVTATNLAGTSVIKVGDQVKLTVVISNYDNDKVTASQTQLFGTSKPILTKKSGTVGSSATFEYQFTLTAGTPLEDTSWLQFQVYAKDDADNEAEAWSNALPYDTIAPGFQDARVTIIDSTGATKPSNTAIIDDMIRFYGDLESLPTDVTLTVDLSGIGGVANQIIPTSPATTTFSLDYKIYQGTSEDYTPRAFTITAKDNGGNIVYRITMPVVYVDNLPPVLTSAQLTKISSGLATAKLNDTIAVQVNVANADGGEVWVDFQNIGGLASDTLSSSGGSTYRLERTVLAPIPGFPAIDSSRTFVIRAKDNAGNVAQITSPGLSIDNEPPLFTLATYTVQPDLSSSHPYVRANDTLTFQATLNGSTPSNPHDAETVTVNLTALGGLAAQALTYDGGIYSYQMTVPAGTVNNLKSFSFTAKDNADNTDGRNVSIPIDNYSPVVGPMTITTLTDVNKVGVMNVGDTYEFGVSCDDPDAGSCKIDLSLLGSSSISMMEYDPALKRYVTTLTATASLNGIEQTGYVFRALVTDKAGNTMSSLASAKTVDCVMPVINWASVQLQDLVGSSTCANVGDKVTITANIELTRLDNGTPKVNLTSLGGLAAQTLYDDGAHDDGGAGDGVFGFTQTVAAGTTNGGWTSFLVELVDDAGNRVQAPTPESIYVDNQPLTISTFIASQSYDNNGNSIVDLDGVFTTYPIIATDVVRLTITVLSGTTDPGSLTVDLTPLGIQNTAYEMLTWTPISGGRSYTEEFTLRPGTVNSQSTKFTATLTDVNGNQTWAQSAQAVTIDNLAPSIIVYPISFVVDNGRKDEANEGDVIRIKIRVTNHDGILPMIDFEKLYLDNGLSAPSPTLFPPTGGPNEYSYDWTVPAGLGTTSPITILAYDVSKNMSVAYSNSIRFLSRVPTFKSFPSTLAELSRDSVPQGYPNRIANATDTVHNTTGDEITFTAVLSAVYNSTNTPTATVLIDIRSLVSSANDDFDSAYNDGDYTTYWYPLTYKSAISGAGNYVYSVSYQVEPGAADFQLASFAVRVLHPDVNSIVLATTRMQCKPTAPFGVDSQFPAILNHSLTVVEENGDNLASDAVNIGDILRVSATITNFPDYISPASVSAFISRGDTGTEFLSIPLSRVGTSDVWTGNFVVATTTMNGWPAMDGVTPHVKIVVNDDAMNFAQSSTIPPNPAFTIDNNPLQILQAAVSISPDQDRTGFANIGDGYETTGDGLLADGLIASVTVAPTLDSWSAWIDLSPIQATSTYGLSNSNFANQRHSPCYSLATAVTDLATYSLTVWVRDDSGNRSSYSVTPGIAIDTIRPSLVEATYDGSVLSLRFGEIIDTDETKFNQTLIYIGKSLTLTSTGGANPQAMRLTSSDTVSVLDDSTTVNITLSPATKAKIADWGSTTLYIGMGHLDRETGEAPNKPSFGWNEYIGFDITGNWIKPVLPLQAKTVIITQPYATRPRLIGSSCIVNVTSDSAATLELVFDKDMDYLNAIDTTTLEQLAIWKSRSDASENYVNRFRFTQNVSSDTIDYPNSGFRSVKINLAQETIDWLALQYTHTSPYINLAVNDPLPLNLIPGMSNNTPLIRDMGGNRIQGIPSANATQAALIPPPNNFYFSTASLISSGSQVLLQIPSFSRRARLYQDFYQPVNELQLRQTTPVSLSKVYIAKNADMTGGSFPLSAEFVDFNSFKAINTDYASTTVTIPLNDSALKTLLSWGSRKVYIACELGAFRDMWNYDSARFPTAGGGSEIPFNPSGESPKAPTVFSVALGPVVSQTNHPSNTSIQLAQGPSLGTTFEVAFETATLSSNIRLPIDQSLTPVLKLLGPDANPLNPIYTATFVGWTTHQMDSVTRTVAQFQNPSTWSAVTLQRASCSVEISNFRDLFESSLVTHATSTALVYDLSQKMTGANGYGGASLPLVLDNQAPKLSQITPNNITLGITPAEAASFTLTFDEAMNAQVGYLPSAYLKSGGSSIALRCTGTTDATNRSFRFVNAQEVNGIEGTFQFIVSSGLDEAGNAYTDANATGTITVKAKGPVLTKFEVRTTQATTGKSDLGLDYSPYSTLDAQPTNIASISVFFSTGSAGDTYWLHFIQNGVTIASRSFTPTVSGDGLVGKVIWDGRQNAADALPIAGRYTYELRVYDNFFNEGSVRGSLVYDSVAPQISQWKLSHGGPIRTGDTMTFFNPQIHSYVKIDAVGAADGGAVILRMAPQNPAISTATQTYTMSPLSPSGKTLSFSGRKTDNSTYMLDGEYLLHLVDGAGNVLYTPSTGLFIDTVGPNIASMSMALTGGQPVTNRFNPKVDSLVISLTTDDLPDVSSGPAYIRIKQGATVIRDLELPAPNGYNYSVTWDGKKAPPSTEYVGEGQYQVMVIDRAENQGVNTGSAYSIPLDIITSDFTFTAVKQTGPTTLLLTFSHDVDPVGAALPARYALTTNPGIDLGDLPQTAVPNGKTVTLTFNTSFTNSTTYTLIVMDGFTSLDGYPFTTQQSLTFVADGQGPQLSQVTFDGVANSQEFNVVFDEVVTATSATNINNYQLFASGTTQVDLDPARIFVRADGRSVRLKSLTTAHIKEGITYTIVAKNISDTLGNAVTTQSLDFVGRDVTPPAIKDNIFVFSNPANPLDISIVVQSNEALKEPPTAAVSQDGGTAQTIKLQASSSNSKLYLGGVHLTKAGTASIKVTATDMTGNTAVETVSFATAYVNASVLASISTPDQAFTAEFAPGSLKQDGFVAVIPTPLQKQAPTASVRGGIRPSVLAGMTAAEKQSRRFETVGGEASEELSPVDVGYTVTVPADQLAGAYSVSMALPGGALPAGAGLYQAADSGKWSSLAGVVKDGRINASVTSAGTFALLRDILAPRVSMLTKIEEKASFRSERPTFEWSIVEEGSGITEDGVKILIDGIESAGRVSLETGKAAFTPLDRLVDGDHTIVMKAKDHAGNERIMPVVRFAVSPALQVFEIIQFPNPARSRATMRVATNRDDVDPDDIDVEIYDISGERVKSHDGLNFMKRFDGSRRVLDMIWDLTSDAGRSVANGIYLAKIKLRDPDSGKTTKVTHKIAVLR